LRIAENRPFFSHILAGRGLAGGGLAIWAARVLIKGAPRLFSGMAKLEFGSSNLLTLPYPTIQTGFVYEVVKELEFRQITLSTGMDSRFPLAKILPDDRAHQELGRKS